MILAEMLRQGGKGTTLVPMADAPAGLGAAEPGVGATIEVQLGRSLNPDWGRADHGDRRGVKFTDGWVDTGDFYEPHTQGTSALLGAEVGIVIVAQFADPLLLGMLAVPVPWPATLWTAGHRKAA